MFPEIRIQLTTLVVGLFAITVAAQAVWAVSTGVSNRNVTVERVIDETKYLPVVTEPPSKFDELVFAPPPSYAVLTPELPMTDITTLPGTVMATAGVAPVAGPAVPRPTSPRG